MDFGQIRVLRARFATQNEIPINRMIPKPQSILAFSLSYILQRLFLWPLTLIP